MFIEKFNLLIYLTLYILLTALTLSVFVIYRPYTYVDNLHSYVICNNNPSKFDIGPNLIFTLTDRLDQSNDIKTRKLCQYNLIKDYNNSLKTPSQINYRFYPIYTQESSWITAVVASFLFFLFGTSLIETVFNAFHPSRNNNLGRLLLNFFKSAIN